MSTTWLVIGIAFLVVMALSALAFREAARLRQENAELRQENAELRKRCAAGDWARYCLAARGEEPAAMPQVGRR